MTWPEPWARKLKAEAVGIGKGKSARVYMATLRCDGSNVAVKEVFGDAKHLDQEVGMMKEFSSHPNFVAYFDHVQGSGHTGYIMMELARGGDLTHVLDGEHRATLQQKYGLFYGALSGVKQMHDRGVVHRDLKPANIFVSPRRCGGKTPCMAKIGDLGQACQARGADLFDGAPRCSGMAGTPSYSAPEFLASGVIGPANDVWALGLILYELTFGMPPEKLARHGLSVEDLESNMKMFDIRSDSLFRSLGGSFLVAELLRGMLALRWQDRLSSAEALRAASALAGHGAPVPAASLPACFYNPTEPTEDSNDDAEEFEVHGVVKYFTLEKATLNIMIIAMSYLFNPMCVEPRTGLVIDPRNELQYLRERNYFPRSLKFGDMILEINDRPYTSITYQDQQRFKQGLYGNTLKIKYESAA